MMLNAVAAAPREDIKPDRAAVHRLFEQGDLVPVYRTLLADLETPVSVYLKLARMGEVSFLLESVEGGEQIGRWRADRTLFLPGCEPQRCDYGQGQSGHAHLTWCDHHSPPSTRSRPPYRHQAGICPR